MKLTNFAALFAAILISAIAISISEAQLLKDVVQTKGGGNCDIESLMSKIPSEATGVVSINWEKLANTKLIDFAATTIIGRRFSSIDDIGIDLKKDIKHVVFGITYEDRSRFYGVIAGTFNSSRILDKVKDAGMKFDESKIGDKTIYSINNVNINFNDTGILFAGPDDAGNSAIKRMFASGQNNITGNPKMVELIKQIDTSTTIWGAVIIPDKLRNNNAENPRAPFNPKALSSLTFLLNYAEKVTFIVSVKFEEVGESGRLVKFLSDRIASINQAEGIPDEIKELMKNVIVTAEEKSTNIEFEMGANKLQKIIESLMNESETIIE